MFDIFGQTKHRVTVDVWNWNLSGFQTLTNGFAIQTIRSRSCYIKKFDQLSAENWTPRHTGFLTFLDLGRPVFGQLLYYFVQMKQVLYGPSFVIDSKNISYKVAIVAKSNISSFLTCQQVFFFHQKLVWQI